MRPENNFFVAVVEPFAESRRAAPRSRPTAAEWGTASMVDDAGGGGGGADIPGEGGAVGEGGEGSEAGGGSAAGRGRKRRARAARVEDGERAGVDTAAAAPSTVVAAPPMVAAAPPMVAAAAPTVADMERMLAQFVQVTATCLNLATKRPRGK